MQPALSEARIDMFARAVAQAAAKTAGNPLLYGPDGKPLPPTADYSYRRTAAKRKGSLKNWAPSRVASRQEEATERTRIAERAIDLVTGDPHAAGVVEGIAMTAIGSGLTPYLSIDADELGIDPELARKIKAAQQKAVRIWWPISDIGERMSFGWQQYLVKRQVVQFGEYLALALMSRYTSRPYSLAVRILHPMRLKTPMDLINRDNIRDGVEMDADGRPQAYWIKRSGIGPYALTDHSANFERIPARRGHRLRVLHGFMPRDAEDVRGVSAFGPGMKFFRDLNDFMDAELVSNVVTAAFALFVEVVQGQNPWDVANFLTSHTETVTNLDDEQEIRRYQEIIPGSVMYGQPGQKPHPIRADRPGSTFDPFTKIIKKALSMSVGIPYPVLFKDVEGVNFAGFRSAMLDAWRTFMAQRSWLGERFCQPLFTMLQEEAWLRGHWPDGIEFYEDMHELTRCEWLGAPKGDIEPIKAAQADILRIKNNLKTHAHSILEDGRDPTAVFDGLAEEYRNLKAKGLPVAADDGSAAVSAGTGEEDGNEPSGSGAEAKALRRSLDFLNQRLNAVADMVEEIRDHAI